jgi:hypothetical protein
MDGEDEPDRPLDAVEEQQQPQQILDLMDMIDPDRMGRFGIDDMASLLVTHMRVNLQANFRLIAFNYVHDGVYPLLI